MISFNHRGNLIDTWNFLKRNQKLNWNVLDKFGMEGVEALSANTPIDTGYTASEWDYRIVEDGDTVRIEWLNHHVVDGVSIAVILQYGHGTGTGGYVEGRDYINPAIRPIFDRIVENVWKEVKR